MLQGQLLDAAAELVKPGGLLVYSTCSIMAPENDICVSNFLLRHRNFDLEPIPHGLIQSNSPAVVDPNGHYLATFPHRHSMDGAFAARLRRMV